ncbi:hypothetical protein Hanom_Chr06g00480801 [Helianthus anomalus]
MLISTVMSKNMLISITSRGNSLDPLPFEWAHMGYALPLTGQTIKIQLEAKNQIFIELI